MEASKLPAPAELMLDEAVLERVLQRMAHEIYEKHPALEAVALIGIPARGVPLAVRLSEMLGRISGQAVARGVLDISMHRDDRRSGRLHAVQPTRLPEPLESKTLLLVDDVLYSGRTIRSALDALSSFGRPARVRLAVLIDRGHRELPIQPDFVGVCLPTEYRQRVFVRLRETDGQEDAIWRERLLA